MFSNWRRAHSATAAVLLVCLAGAGCGSPKTDEPDAPKESVKIKVELVPEGSEIGSLRHFYGGPAQDTLIETEVSYRDGRTGIIKYNPDNGLISRTIEYTKTGKLKSQCQYKLDGKSIKEGSLYRPDGTLKLLKRSTAAGVVSDYYWIDGRFLFFSELQNRDGSIERTIYNRDGSILAKSNLVYWQGVRHNPVEHTIFYSPAGKPQVKVMRTGSGRIHEFIRADGTLSHRQIWRYRGGDNIQGETLESVEQFGPDGKTTVRQLLFREENGVVTPVSSTDPETGNRLTYGTANGARMLIDVYQNAYTGEKRQRFLQPGDVISEENTDSAGKPRTITYKPGERPAVDIATWLVTFPPVINDLQMTGYRYEQVREWEPWEDEPNPGDDVIRRWYYKQSLWYQI